MGTKLIKNHLYFHLKMYIEMWGPLLGWDASENKSNGKTEVKGPANNTQKRPDTIMYQTSIRYHEKSN